jgi:hypothetical protein
VNNLYLYRAIQPRRNPKSNGYQSLWHRVDRREMVKSFQDLREIFLLKRFYIDFLTAPSKSLPAQKSYHNAFQPAGRH